MRFQSVRGSREQRAEVRRRFEALMRPETALELIRRRVAPGAEPVRAHCAAARDPWDRYVVQVVTEAANGDRAAYALKGYLDGRGEDIAAVYAGVARYWRQCGEPCPVVLPLDYLPEEKLMVSSWVRGISLAQAIAAGRDELIDHAIRHAPRTLAQLQATPIVPEAATGAATMVQLTGERWQRHFRRFPETRAFISPLVEALHAALPALDPPCLRLVHGDTGPGNFLWDGERWVMLDLDTYGYADAAYDMGYLLAKLEYQCLGNPQLQARTPEIVAAMRSSCLASLPGISQRNCAFYYAMTLIRKTLTRLLRSLPDEERGQWQTAIAPVAARAMGALHPLLGEGARA